VAAKPGAALSSAMMLTRLQQTARCSAVPKSDRSSCLAPRASSRRTMPSLHPNGSYAFLARRVESFFRERGSAAETGSAFLRQERSERRS
jgi:hypothetical protein